MAYARNAATPGQVGRRSARPAKRATTLLLVEDEPSVRRTVRLMLESGGFNVIAAASGADALAALAGSASPVQALVTDLNMPGMSGFDLVSHLLERGPAMDLPVLFISGQPAPLPAHWPATVPRRFLAKPFTLAQLLAEVQAILPLRLAQQSLP